MAASSLNREIGDYIIDKDDEKCLGRTYKVAVYPGKSKHDASKSVAGKMFLWEKRFSSKIVDDEIEFMKSIPPHENVLKLLHHDTVEIGKYKELWLILEHCNLGHLGEFVHTRPLNLAQKLDLMVQSAKGVHHLHHMDKPLIHRDIKPANLLVAGKPGQPVVKVADYGESRYFEGSREQSVRNITVGGTPYYQAPEIFSDNKSYKPKQNKAVDIFALGMSFQYVLEAEMEQFDQTPLTVGKEEIALGRHLYDNPNTDVARLLMKPGDSADVRDIKLLIAEMLARDVRKRLTIDQVLLRLRELRTRLGTQTLVAVDTVWDDPVFYFDKDLMKSIEVKFEEKKSSDAKSSGPADPQEHRATPDPPERNARLRMDHAERVLSDTKDVLDQLSRLRVRCEQLLAVSVHEYDRGVWVHEGSEWERVSDMPSDCAGFAVCLCRVHGGMIVCGGGGYHEEASDHCHHFSLLTRHWRKLSGMLTPRWHASAVEYDDRKLLVAGGVTSAGKSAVCEVLDCEMNEWVPSTNLPEALSNPLIAADGGKVYILRQFGIRDQPRLVIYEPLNEEGKSTRASIKYTSALPNDVRSTLGASALPDDVGETWGACLAAAGQRLYLLGGGERLALAYTPLTDQWEHLTPPSLRYTWDLGCCADVSAGHITVFGGISTIGGERDGAEVYDTRAGKWQTLDMRLPFEYDKDFHLVARYDE